MQLLRISAKLWKYNLIIILLLLIQEATSMTLYRVFKTYGERCHTGVITEMLIPEYLLN